MAKHLRQLKAEALLILVQDGLHSTLLSADISFHFYSGTCPLHSLASPSPMALSPELPAHSRHPDLMGRCAIVHIAIAFALEHGFAGGMCSLFSAAPSAKGRKPSLVEVFIHVFIPQDSVMSPQEDPGLS
jgi:hypothetical protein